MLTDLEKWVILGLQRDLEVVPQPFKELAEQLGIGEEELLSVIRSLMDQGYIRRFGATLRHQQSGFAANALIVWEIPDQDISRLGKQVAAFREVSHCYARRPAPGWSYTLYSMVHGRTPEEIQALASRMAAEIGIDRYELLFSESELKKTTMRYFREE